MIRPEYAEALVRLHLPSGPVLIAQTPPGEHDGAFPAEAGGGALCIITAHNPAGRTYPPSENRAFHAKLLARLNADGLTWWPAAGGDSEWTHVEESVAIAGLDPEKACEIGREFGQDAIFAWTAADWQIRSCNDGAVANRGWEILPTPPELAEIDAAYRELGLASPYVPLLHVHAAVNRRIVDAAPEDAARLELAAAKLAKEYHRVKAAADERVRQAHAQEAARMHRRNTEAAAQRDAARRVQAEEERLATADRAERREASRKRTEERHERDVLAGWPQTWRPRNVDRWLRLSGTAQQATDYDEHGWNAGDVVAAAAQLGSAELLRVPVGDDESAVEFGDEPQDVLTGRIPGTPTGTILVIKRVFQNGRQERWHVTDSGNGLNATRHIKAPGDRWHTSHHGRHETLEDAFTTLRSLRRVPSDAATEILAPGVDDARIAALLSVPEGNLAGPEGWPNHITSDWMPQDEWLARELGWPLHAMVRLRINEIRPIPWRHSRPSKWLHLDLEEQEWFPGGDSRHEEIAEFTWYSESGGAPISWDGGNVLDLVAPDVIAAAQWGDYGNNVQLIPWPTSVRGRAALLADWISSMEIDTVAAIDFEGAQHGVSLNQWEDVTVSLWINVEDEVIDALRRRLARHSDMYRATMRALQHPTTARGRRLRAALADAAETGVMSWIHGSWVDTHIDGVEPIEPAKRARDAL